VPEGQKLLTLAFCGYALEIFLYTIDAVVLVDDEPDADTLPEALPVLPHCAVMRASFTLLPCPLLPSTILIYQNEPLTNEDVHGLFDTDTNAAVDP
jgi:hypothetical protein